MDALRARSAAEARENLEALDTGAYNPFNLLVADRESVHAVTYDERPRPVHFSSGAIVIGNADPTEAPTPKLSALHGQVERAAKAGARVFVTGNAFFQAPDPDDFVRQMHARLAPLAPSGPYLSC